MSRAPKKPREWVRRVRYTVFVDGTGTFTMRPFLMVTPGAEFKVTLESLGSTLAHLRITEIIPTRPARPRDR